MDDAKPKGLIQTVNAWFTHPFNSQGSALNWVLFVGLMVIAVFLWQLVLLEFSKEVASA
jgi:uncharacterized membrane protein YjjB (DUF3815 family)